MSNQLINVAFKGLVTNTNLVKAPDGSCSILNNCTPGKPGIIQARKGFTALQYALSVTTAVLTNGIFMRSTGAVVSWFRDATAGKTFFKGLLGGVDDSDSGAVALEAAAGLDVDKYLYWLSNVGVRKYDNAFATSFGPAGIPRALDTRVQLGAGAVNILPNNNQYAYRVLWGLVEADVTVRYGAPGGRVILLNTSGVDQEPVLTIPIPDGMTVSNFYQIYRSFISASTSIEGSDEMNLVYQNNPTLAEIAADEVVYHDITPEGIFAGGTIYTAPSQEGVDQANNPPPLAHDLALYKNMMFLSNTNQRHTLNLIYLGGFADGDTLKISTETYTARFAPGNPFEFQLYAGVTVAAINDTMRSLAVTIGDDSSLFNAYFTSGKNDIPGKISIERKNLDGAIFYANSNNQVSWSPTLLAAGNDVFSDNETRKNRVYFSKVAQYEAFPELNYIDLGSAESAVIRIVPLRTCIMAMKDDGEIYSIYGTDPVNLQAQLLEGRAKIIGTKTAVVLDNTIFMFSNQKVVSVSEAGVRVVSYAIEDTLNAYLGTANDSLWAVGWESQRLYILGIGNKAFVYNYLTDVWTTWDLPTMVIAVGGGVTYSVNGTYKGGAIDANDNLVLFVQSKKSDDNMAVMRFMVANSAGTAADYQDKAQTGGNFPFSVEWMINSIHGETQAIMKQAREVGLAVNNRTVSFDVDFKSNLRPDTATVAGVVPLIHYPNGVMGDCPYGSAPMGYGAPSSKETQVREYFPVESQRGLWHAVGMSAVCAGDNLEVHGLAITYEPQGNEVFAQ